MAAAVAAGVVVMGPSLVVALAVVVEVVGAEPEEAQLVVASEVVWVAAWVDLVVVVLVVATVAVEAVVEAAAVLVVLAVKVAQQFEWVVVVEAAMAPSVTYYLASSALFAEAAAHWVAPERCS